MGSGASKTTKQEGVYSKSKQTHNKFSETQWKKERQKVEKQKVQHQKVEHQKAVYRDILTEKQVNQNTSSETSRVVGLNMDKGLVNEEHVGESPTLNTSEDHTVGKESGFNITEALGIEGTRHEVSCKESEIQPIGMVQNGYKSKELPNKNANNLDNNEADDTGSINVGADNEEKLVGDTEADNENHPTKDEINIMIIKESSLEINQKSDNDNKDCTITETPLDSKITQGFGDDDKVEDMDSSVTEKGNELQVGETTATTCPGNQNTSGVNKEEECHPIQDNADDDKDIVYAKTKTETVLRVTSETSERIDSIDSKNESDYIPGLHHSEDSKMIEDCPKCLL